MQTPIPAPAERPWVDYSKAPPLCMCGRPQPCEVHWAAEHAAAATPKQLTLNLPGGHR